jgi:hypothetical protein
MNDPSKEATVHRHDASDASAVELRAELLALAEDLAAHVHEAWMRVRLSEGWSYARERDDARRTHPCLVPYEELPEADKACDRQVTLGTLRAIERLGFTIVKRD